MLENSLADNTPPAPKRRGKGPGRPPLPADERRDRRVEVFLSVSEVEQLSNASDATGLKLPAFIRSAALGLRPKARVPLADVKLSGDLKRLGNLFDQIAHNANAGRITGVDAATVNEWSAYLDRLSSVLLGANYRDCNPPADSRNGYEDQAVDS